MESLLKYFFPVLIFFLFNNAANAQCLANAGQDKVFCFDDLGRDSLGGIPAATGGVPPYSYAWETSYSVTIGSNTINYTASDFLNDTSLANPSFIFSTGDPLTFTLTVTDAVNNVCKDSVKVRFSTFMELLGNITFQINAGDSIFLDFGTNIGGGFPPYTYLWRPNHGLTDSTSLSFWAKPDTTIAYYVSVTDSANCSIVGAPYYFINVKPLSVNNINIKAPNISVYPNPSTDIINFQLGGEVNSLWSVELYDLSGKLVKAANSRESLISVNRADLPAGMLLYRVKVFEVEVGQGSIVVK